jgi:hypothetical protein
MNSGRTSLFATHRQSGLMATGIACLRTGNQVKYPLAILLHTNWLPLLDGRLPLLLLASSLLCWRELINRLLNNLGPLLDSGTNDFFHRLTCLRG